MGWKEFIKPDCRKILFFIFTMGVLNYIWISANDVLDTRLLFGLPLGFYPKGSFYLASWENPPVVEFSWFNFIIDIIFWYLVACGIFYICDIIKKKYRNPL